MKRLALFLAALCLMAAPVSAESAKETEVSQDILEAEGSIYDLKVKSAEIIEKADDYGTEVEPDNGYQFLVVRFEAKNISDEDNYLNRYNFLGYADDFEAKQLDYHSEGEHDGIMTGDVVAGKGMRGYLIFEVPDDWEVFEVMYEEKYREPKLKMMFTRDGELFDE